MESFMKLFGNFQKHTFVAPRNPLPPTSPDFVNFFISLVRANLEVPRLHMGTRKVLGMVGWYGRIYSPTPLLVADVVEYQYLESRGSYIT